MNAAIRWFPHTLNVLTIISGAAMWMYICNDTLTYFAGSTARDAIILLFAVCLFAQFARTVIPMATRSRGGTVGRIAVWTIVVILGVLMYLEQDQFFKRELDRQRADRISYSGESDLAIMRAFTDRYFYYPPESFLEEARHTIPVEDAVLYIGDIRPDPVNYALYPRPVYAIPELQRATLDSAIRAWSRQVDPAFPEGFAAWLEDDAIDAANIEAETRALIRERGIRWVVLVDAFDESANRIVRLRSDQ